LVLGPFEILTNLVLDPLLNWCEVARLTTASSIATAKAFNQQWLSRYPRPLECVHDNGNKFLGIKFQELLLSYGIKPKPTTVKNPQANAIVEHIFGTLKEQLRATIFKTSWSKDIDTLIQACAFALRVTTPAHGPYSPAQLAFGYDPIFCQKVVIDWEQKKALHQ
jgi:transposase InsO family protein